MQAQPERVRASNSGSYFRPSPCTGYSGKLNSLVETFAICDGSHALKSQTHYFLSNDIDSNPLVRPMDFSLHLQPRAPISLQLAKEELLAY